MDVLFTGDIPADYTFATFGNGYINLYNKPYASNTNMHYYRIWTNCDGFYYSEGNQYFGNTLTEFQEIKTSNNWLYRPDIDKIFLCCFILVILFIFVFNIVTSVFKKGGVFGGLL